jgi:FkbM family methyltransferase
MIVDKLEDTLNGGYGGLYGEVVTEDTYGLRKVKGPVDVIFDLGANVGTFTRFARELFPEALIVAIEPDEENFIHLKKFTNDTGVVFMKRALGEGDIFRRVGAPNGAHENYIQEGMGYNSEYDITNVVGIMLDELVNTYWHPGQTSLMKIDVEGAENSIWDHKKSMEALQKMDYIMLELHYCVDVGNHAAIKEMAESTVKGIMELTKSHHCYYDHIYFYAVRKNKYGD